MLKGLSGGAIGGQLPGLVPGAGITAGSVGQIFVVNTTAPVTLTVSGTAYNIASIPLTSGNWWLYGQVDFILSTTTISSLQAGVSATSATFGTQAAGGGFQGDTFTVQPWVIAGGSQTISLPSGMPQPVYTSGATVYLVASAAFSVGGVTAVGTLIAERFS